MLQAIIAGLVTLIVLVVGVLIVFNVRSSRSEQRAKSSLHYASIRSVGVSAETPRTANGTRPAHVQEGSRPGTVPAEAVRSRFTAVFILLAIVFGSLAAKLWSLQILQSEQYRRQADENRYTTVMTPAPRGVIYDRNGVALVTNRTSLTVLADAEVANDRDVLLRLSALLGLPYGVVRQRAQDTTGGAQSQRVIASDVDLRNIAFISEHQDAFPGVTTEARTDRIYPYGALAAHALGYVQTVSESDLENMSPGQELEMGDMVGRSGAEQSFESLLAGDHGVRQLVADAEGNVRQVVSEIPPTKGNDVYLTIDAKVQTVADQALAELVAPGGAFGSGTGTAAAIVCMDATNGDIIAMSSYPTYNPADFVHGISDERYDAYNNNEYHPLNNRVISGEYAAGSTYKAFTGLAGMEYGFATPSTAWTCSGTWTGFGEEYAQDCWDLNGHGTIDLRTGVVVSCDTVFYEIAKNFYLNRESIGEDAMQNVIKEFGFGRATGIDLAGEAVGRVPTPQWKREYYADAPEEQTWLPGDSTNMVIGQGNVLVTPMQLAVGYVGVATGRLLQPHIFKEARNSEGNVVLTAQTVETGVPNIEQDYYDYMRDALHGMATEDSTVAPLFAERGISAASKTGTAEVFGKEDFALFACYAPYEDPKYVVACVVEEGIGGASAAAPVSADVMAAALSALDGTLETQPTVFSA